MCPLKSLSSETHCKGTYFVLCSQPALHSMNVCFYEMLCSQILIEMFSIFSHLDLCMNPLISSNLFNQLPNDVQHAIFDYLLTPEASIKLFNSQASWIQQMESIDSGEFISSDTLPEGKNALL